MKYILVTKKATSKEGNLTYYPNEVIIARNNISQNKWYKIITDKELLAFYYDKIDKKCNNVLIICGGGIGDIIAYSALCKYLHEKGKNVHFATQKKYFDILKWFQTPVEILDVEKPIFRDFSLSNRISKYNTWRRIFTELIIPNHNESDWFEVIFAYAGIEKIEDSYFRPQLKTNRLTRKKSNIDKKQKSLLICNQSSCMMRNIEFDEIYRAIPEDVKKDYKIYAYMNNLSVSDKIHRENKKYKDVEFINSPTLSDFLNDLYDVTDVITVDSAAVHFREGINKRCLALYNSFDKDCRTKYYKYITAVNIKSECDKQPCFKHELNKGDLCEKVKEWQYSAPCFRSESNKFLQPEFKRIFNEYFK
mgnify:CR=1 FL=1|jgi:ADP-heptose:LPS heptosyltransferase